MAATHLPPSGDQRLAPVPAAPSRSDPGVLKAPSRGGSLGLASATALVVGSIVGVGIFNLPTSLSSYGPISLVSMGLTTIGAVALGRTGSRPGPATPPSRSAGSFTSRS